MYQIKQTTATGTSFPTDLQNLSYSDAVTQLNLLAQNSGSEDFEADRQAEDVLCLNHANGTYTLYEIEEVNND